MLVDAGANVTELAEKFEVSVRTMPGWLKEMDPKLFEKARDNGNAYKWTHGQRKASQKAAMLYAQEKRARAARERLLNPAPVVDLCGVTKAMRWLQRYGVCFPMRVRERSAKDYFFKGNRISASQVLEEATSRGWLDESVEA